MFRVGSTRALISARVLLSARITLMFSCPEVRNFSKITTNDRGGPRKPRAVKLHDKVFGKIANEGRKLANVDFIDGSSAFLDGSSAFLDGSSDFIDKPNESNEYPDDDTRVDVYLNHSDEKKEFYRNQIKRPYEYPVLRDTTPSSLFVPAPDPSEQNVSKLSLYEEHLEFSYEYLNSHLYKNPFKEMKADPYDLNYPIDNQDGQEAEREVSFRDHVLLDDLYEGFPKTGPIRNFMELVITGLSQNPFLTPEEKREHVAWFKEEVATLSPDDIKKMDTYYEQLILKKERKRRKTNISS